MKVYSSVFTNQVRNPLNPYSTVNFKGNRLNLFADVEVYGNRVIFHSGDKGSCSINFNGKVVYKSTFFNDYEITEMKNFTSNNSYALKWLMTTRITVDDFLKVMIKGGEKASDREIELQREAVNRIVFGD